MRAEAPQPVKFLIAVLHSDEPLLERAVELCQNRIGSLDSRSEAFVFSATSYYVPEMGADIKRTLMSLETLRSPGELARLKVICNQIETELSLAGARKVNLDIGYMDFHKLVLASAKYNGQKIYLDLGIYADTTLIFESGEFRALENTFPDFQSGIYNPFLMEIRKKYKAQLKS